MSKYDKMLELNKRKSEEKVERAVLTIRTMVLEREKVSVPALMQKTGLSRGFFYKNPIVRGEIDAAMEQQAGMVDPRRNIISQAMEAEMNLLRQQLQKLKSENENLIRIIVKKQLFSTNHCFYCVNLFNYKGNLF